MKIKIHHTMVYNDQNVTSVKMAPFIASLVYRCDIFKRYVNLLLR